MRKRTWFAFGGVLLWLLLLLPFFLGAPAAHPATDDFTFAAYTHPTWVKTLSLPHVVRDAVSYALRTYRDWQGTFTGVVIMALNPAVFSLRGYWLHAAILLLLNTAAALVFLSHFLARLSVPPSLRVPLCLCLSAAQLIFLPDPVEGIYWFNGAWFYTGANAIALLTLTLCDRIPEGGGPRIPRTALAAALLFFLGMDNYITAMMTLCSLFLLACLRAYAVRERGLRGALLANRRLFLLLLPIALGLFLSAAAPGNRVRMAADGAYQGGLRWLFSSFLWTARDAGKYILRFSFKTPLLALLLIFTPPLSAALPPGGKAGGAPPVFASLAGFYLALCGMILPHMVSSGYAGSGRVVNMYHDFAVLFLPLVWILVLRRMPETARARLRGRRGRAGCGCAALAALLICLSGGQLKNYQKLISDQLDGTQRAYIEQFENEYALCQAAGPEDDVLLPPWRVQTVTGKPTAYADPTVWTNVSMADYFGVRTVRVWEKDASPGGE